MILNTVPMFMSMSSPTIPINTNPQACLTYVSSMKSEKHEHIQRLIRTVYSLMISSLFNTGRVKGFTEIKQINIRELMKIISISQNAKYLGRKAIYIAKINLLKKNIDMKLTANLESVSNLSYRLFILPDPKEALFSF